MSRICKTLKAEAKTAMSFIGRMFARLRNVQKRAKLRLDSVELVVKESLISIFVDGMLVLQATRESFSENNWNIDLTEKFNNLIQA